MQLHILALFSGISPLISSSEKAFSSLFSMTPSLCRLREAPSHLSCDTVFPIPCCQTLAVLPPTKKIEGFARDDDTGNVLSSFLLPCIGYSSRRPSFRAQREIFFVPLFPTTPSLSLLREAPPTAFPAKRSLGSARDDDTEKCFLSTAFAGYVG